MFWQRIKIVVGGVCAAIGWQVFDQQPEVAVPLFVAALMCVTWSAGETTSATGKR